MPYFLVPIAGDAARAAGLLAVAGIQNLIRTDPDDGPVTIARVSASDATSAVDRVARALEGAFTVEEAVLED